jgi:hypothetical protein
MMARRLLVPLALAATLIAARDDPLGKALAGRVAGKPVSCIAASWVNGPTIIDERTILYREGAGRRVWITHPRGRCVRLRDPATLITQIYGGNICRNDRFQLLESGSSIPSAFCRFDDFTPYDRVKAD